MSNLDVVQMDSSFSNNWITFKRRLAVWRQVIITSRLQTMSTGNLLLHTQRSVIIKRCMIQPTGIHTHYGNSWGTITELPHSWNSTSTTLISSAVDFINTLGRRISSVSGEDKESAFLFQRISITIQRFNSILLLESFPMTTTIISHSMRFFNFCF